MNKKKSFLQVLFLLVLIVGSVLIIRQHANMPYQKNQGNIFGTYYHITYQYDEDLQQLIERELKKVDAAFSMFNDSSTVSKINRGENILLNEQFANVYRLAERVNKETDGAFDITVAPLVNAWGFGFKNEQLPTDAQVDSLLAYVGQHHLTLEEKVNGTWLRKDDPRVMLDFSAIAKGYGCDVVAQLFKVKGVKNFLVEIGGEIVAKGVNPNKKAWTIGVNKPNEDSLMVSNEVDTILSLSDCGLATSGNYRNFYVKEGKKYAHTIDPKSGRPVQHSLLSATVIAENCASADAYATSFMVMGLEKVKVFLHNHPELEALLIYADKEGQQKTIKIGNRKD